MSQDFCPQCGNYIYASFKHVCPPGWLCVEFYESRRGKLDEINERELVTVYAFSPADAAECFWKIFCDEYDQKSGKCAVASRDGERRWDIFECSIEETISYKVRPEGDHSHIQKGKTVNYTKVQPEQSHD